MALRHLRSTTESKRPQASGMTDGQLAINTASGSPGLFFKDTAGSIVKIGPVHVGATAPNASPASGGTTGNSIGEQWLDNSGGTYVFKIWDGAAWRSEAGEFVNSTGDTMTGSLTMGASANIIFEGSVDDGFETTLTVVNPTADRTITLPNVTGTVVTTGDSGTVTSTMIADGTIVNADVNASAAIAGTKIAPNFGSQTVQTTGVFSAASGSASAPSIAFTGDTDTGIYSPGTDQVAISTNGTGRLSVDANGNVAVDTNTLYVDAVNNEVGVGTANPSATAHVQTTRQFSSASGTTSAGLLVSQSGGTPAEGAYGTAITLSKINSTRPGGAIASVQTTADDDQLGLAFLVHSSSVANDTLTEALRISHAGTATFTASSSTAPFIANIGASEAARIDSSGRLLMGTSTAYTGGSNITSKLQIHGLDASNSGVQGTRWSNNNASSWISLQKSRGTSVGSRAIVLAEDVVGTLDFAADDGTNFLSLARIDARVDGTPNANDMPGRLVFSTTADGASFPTERMRIDSQGRVGVGTSSPGHTLEINGDCQIGAYSDYGNSGLYVTGRSTFNDRAINIMSTDGNGGGTIGTTGEATSSNGLLLHAYRGGGSIQFQVNNSERLRITSDGKVGVGTTVLSTYGGKLVVVDGAVGGETTLVLANNSQDQFARLGINNNEAQIAWDNGDALVFGTAATSATAGLTSEFARIDSSGRLLVGTSSQSGGALLQVNGDRVRIATAKTPASASDTGTTGEICWDANYVYVCTATNTWKRSALSSW